MSVFTRSGKNVDFGAWGVQQAEVASERDFSRDTSRELVRPRPTGAPPSERLWTFLPPLILAIILLTAWFVGSGSGQVARLFLPAPADVWQSLIDGLASGMFLSNALVTIQESLLGFLLAVVIAMPLGYALAKSRVIASAVNPYLAAGQAIPAIVIAPLLVLWIGNGLIANMILCMLVVLFPMIMTTALGVQTIDHTLTDAARVEGAGGFSLLFHIEFPLALPALLSAVKTGLTLSIMGALVGEFVIGGDVGLGSLILQARNQFDVPLMFATLAILCVLAALYFALSWGLTKLAQAIYF